MGRRRGPGYYDEGGVWVSTAGIEKAVRQAENRRGRSSTSRSTSFRDKPQRDDPTVTNTYFNSGEEDGADHGHVKYRNNPDGTTDYLYVRDVEGNEYDV